MASNTSPFEASRREPVNRLPWILGGAALLMGAGLFYFLNYTTPAAPVDAPLTAEGKAYTRNLKLSDVTMKATSAYFGQKVVEIEGKIANAGDRQLKMVEVNCVFQDSYGQLILRKRMAIVGAKMGSLQPGDTKSFRLAFDEVPDSWNQAMPKLVIASVTF